MKTLYTNPMINGEKNHVRLQLNLGLSAGFNHSEVCLLNKKMIKQRLQVRTTQYGTLYSINKQVGTIIAIFPKYYR